MGGSRSEILAVFFVVLIGARGSCFSFGEILRVLASDGGHGGISAHKDGSPSPTPGPVMEGDKRLSGSVDKKPSKPDGGANGASPKTDQTTKPASPKNLAGTVPGGPPNGSTAGKGQNADKDKHVTPQGKTQDDIDCDVETYRRCSDHHGLVACLRRDDSGLEHVVVKNEGEEALTVKIKVPPSVDIAIVSLQLEKHQHKKIDVSFKVQGNPYIILNAGHKNCSLQPDASLSKSTFFQNFPAYATQMTPIYGAYVLILTVLIVGGVWACCKFGRSNRRGNDGVPYRELEMGLPQSTSAMDMDTVEGWDQGWDDDWDDRPMDNTSEIRPVGSISENGLSSRSINKEGWDNDWDD